MKCFMIKNRYHKMSRPKIWNMKWIFRFIVKRWITYNSYSVYHIFRYYNLLNEHLVGYTKYTTKMIHDFTLIPKEFKIIADIRNKHTDNEVYAFIGNVKLLDN